LPEEPIEAIPDIVVEDGVVPFERDAIIEAFIPDYEEPPKRPADYVPTPPKPELVDMSPVGESSISFKDAVYELVGNLADL